MASQSETVALQKGIDVTLDAIERRVGLYRGLMVAVFAFLAGSAGVSAALRSWWPLTGLTLIVPATGAYLALDRHHLRVWVAQIRDLQGDQNLNLQVFSEAMQSRRLVPRATLQPMLVLLGLGQNRQTC